MFRRLPKRISLALGCLALAFGLPLNAEDAVQHDPRPQLALMGTVPIYWGEAAWLDELIQGSAAPHWARDVLERQFDLHPIDFLTPEVLAQHRFLLMAQPRALAPTENIALDGWVRSGGHLMLLADPMMTGESRFSIGDRRRPQDVALLSPILAHWGLELQFDEQQVAGLHAVKLGEETIPLNLPGHFVLADSNENCLLQDGGVMAICQPANGRVLILADAAILDFYGPHQGAEAAFSFLSNLVFDRNGESAGNSSPKSMFNSEGHANLADSPNIEPEGPDEAAP